ncbi:DUF2860 family protein [uncultured Vibrio sp.]|uniref:DUF2860 family protein n=1 Tax=uncultured Vibrio sp. TaxID=114054 RepID=UPI0025ED7ED7|nr:DUF2860 family protein [uncultured Vibrio sp.]
MTHSNWLVQQNRLFHPMFFMPSLQRADGSRAAQSPSKRGLPSNKWPLKLLMAGSVLVTPFSYAEPQNATGLHGSVSLFTGIDGTNSVMNTESPANLSDYSASQDRQNEAVVIPFWDLNYRFSGASEVYFKTDIVGMASDFYTQAGYRYNLTDGSKLAIGVVPGLLEKEVWKNPYQLQSDRTTTKAAVQGIVLNYEQILGTDWSVELARGKYAIDQEESMTALDRNSTLSYAELNYMTDLSERWGFNWLISYLDIDATGSALKSKRVNTEAEFQLRNGRHITMLASSVGLQQFDDTNPIWDRTREDKKFGVAATYIYAAPFNWKRALFIARGGWDVTDANIDFYDHDEYLVTLGMQYRF